MYEKFTTALKLMDDVILNQSNETQIYNSFDALFDYIHANFIIPETSSPAQGKHVSEILEYITEHQEYDLCKPLVDHTYNGKIAELIYKIPPIIAEVVFPVAVARFLLRENGISINFLKTKTFDTFYKRYGAMILQS